MYWSLDGKKLFGALDDIISVKILESLVDIISVKILESLVDIISVKLFGTLDNTISVDVRSCEIFVNHLPTTFCTDFSKTTHTVLLNVMRGCDTQSLR
ncbi:hypothetical protein [Siminovitchia fordii]|uniref:hypothetical protein n=1 Tax=Siminovitchia fordii TaxID=254759 RepID=UPI001B7FBA1A|nr:hypothetical protein [Siminovitchia fordii]